MLLWQTDQDLLEAKYPGPFRSKIISACNTLFLGSCNFCLVQRKIAPQIQAFKSQGIFKVLQLQRLHKVKPVSQKTSSFQNTAPLSGLQGWNPNRSNQDKKQQPRTHHANGQTWGQGGKRSDFISGQPTTWEQEKHQAYNLPVIKAPKQREKMHWYLHVDKETPYNSYFAFFLTWDVCEIGEIILQLFEINFN